MSDAILCETCGRPTAMTSTKRCDACYEVELRLASYLREGGEKARAFVDVELSAAERAEVAALRARVMQLQSQNLALLLPGWICVYCKVFNGSAKEELKECRCCGKART